jgi:muramoyltetrapeptide carboxypeptidase
LCARGGYGTVQLLPLLDKSIISNNPKWLIGYSDVTVLHSYIHNHTSMQSLHASMPINFKDYTTSDRAITSMFDILEGRKVEYNISASSYNKNGEAEGVVVGGNLSIIYSLRGTNIDLDTAGKILFIEDLDEYLYHIDRIMMNLKIGGKLDNLKALIIGGMNDMNDNDIPFGRTAKQIIFDAVKEYNYPVLFNFPSGHIFNNYGIPIGRNIKLKVTSDSVLVNI